MSDTYQQTIVNLEAERGPLAHRVALIDQAIQGLRELAGSEKPARSLSRQAGRQVRAASQKEKAGRRPTTTAGPDKATYAERILEALKYGPRSTGDLRALLKRTHAIVRQAMQPLIAKGLVHRTGSGPANYRWHLAKPAQSAKEAPSRRAGEHVE